MDVFWSKMYGIFYLFIYFKSYILNTMLEQF